MKTWALGVSFQSMRAAAKVEVSDGKEREVEGRGKEKRLWLKGEASNGSHRSGEKGSKVLLLLVIDISVIASNLKLTSEKRLAVFRIYEFGAFWGK